MVSWNAADISIVARAVCKRCEHIQGQQTESAATAIQMLAEQNLAPNIRPIALTSPNAFRTERLYTEEVDVLYKKHLVLLKAIYSACRRAPNGGGLRLKVRPSMYMCSMSWGVVGAN